MFSGGSLPEKTVTNSQKLAVRLSEIRQRLNEIAGLETDAMTDEVRAESDRLAAEFAAKETQHRAAIIAEGEEEARARGEFGNGDGQPAEVRALLGRVNIGEYLARAAAGVGLVGAPAELAAALNVPAVGASGGVCLPFEVLAGPEVREARVFTDTGSHDGPIAQRPILQRLFGPGILDQLGVRIDSVPVGRAEWPLIATGVDPAMKTEGTAADAAVETTFQVEVLKPKRLTGQVEFTHEVVASVPEIESALRRDLQDAVRSKMSALILTGNEATKPEQPDGFLTTLTAPADPTNESAYGDYARAHSLGVDGIHASMEGEVSSVIGVASYRHSAGVYNTGSGESGSEALKRRSMSCMASSYIPAAASDIQNGNVFHSAGPNGGAMRGDSIAALWPSLEIVRDIYSKASTGVVLTWVSLWDAQTAFRAAAYRRVSFKLA